LYSSESKTTVWAAVNENEYVSFDAVVSRLPAPAFATPPTSPSDTDCPTAYEKDCAPGL
jgi:hypothetical protein